MCFDYFELFGLTASDFYSSISRAGAHFWEHLEAYPHAYQLYDLCCDYAPTYLATTPTLDSGSVAGKYKWIERFTGYQRFNNFIFTAHKHLLAAPGRLLIDDRGVNCDAFRAAGGEAILFPAPWNERRAIAEHAFEVVKEEIGEWAVRT